MLSQNRTRVSDILGGSGPDRGALATRRSVVLLYRITSSTNEHTHPSLLGPDNDTGSGVTFSAPGSEDLCSADPEGNYLEIRLTATDLRGLSKTVGRDLRPETTDVRFATAPTKFFVIVNGEKIRAPLTLLS
jgi:hypothetical protein